MLHDAEGHGEPEAGPPADLFGGEEWFKYTGNYFFVHPRPGILGGQLEGTAEGRVVMLIEKGPVEGGWTENTCGVAIQNQSPPRLVPAAVSQPRD